MPHRVDALPCRERDRGRNEPGVQQEIHRCRADERPREHHHWHARADAPAEQMKREPGALNRDDEGRHAEQRAVERISVLAVQAALAERARRRDEHRLVGAD